MPVFLTVQSLITLDAGNNSLYFAISGRTSSAENYDEDWHIRWSTMSKRLGYQQIWLGTLEGHDVAYYYGTNKMQTDLLLDVESNPDREYYQQGNAMKCFLDQGIIDRRPLKIRIQVK